jgi:hypothetical protein
VGIIKDISDKHIDFRYRIITSTDQYLLDTNQKDLSDSLINTIGFWIYDPNYKPGMVCWKRLETDKIEYKKVFAEVLTWSDRLSFKEFQIAVFSAFTLLVFFILRIVHT